MSLLQVILAFLLGWTTYDHLVHASDGSLPSASEGTGKTLIQFVYTIARSLFVCINIFAAVDLIKVFTSKFIALNVQAEAFFAKIQVRVRGHG